MGTLMCNIPDHFLEKGHCGDVSSDLTNIVQEINKWRARLVFGRQLNGNPFNETTRPLYPGRYIYELKFDCALQSEATSALNKTPNDCLSEKPSVPRGRTGFHYIGNPAKGVKSWLGEIHKNKVNALGWENELKYQKINRNYFNFDLAKFKLVRANTSRIGCAAKSCGGTKKLYCLTNNKPLKNGDTVYEYSDTDNGGCPINKCPEGSTCAYACPLRILRKRVRARDDTHIENS
ncbi:SCP-like protein [Ancylostoma ceylanicum]|uniref:SCP-like protein n=1 Tax=Ancylostoma ceylanicum TaxID=53326 RepID=A0A0D6LUJ9_9BILA|nr:SCP-like protein [Ancylostoma ceylanicum]